MRRMCFAVLAFALALFAYGDAATIWLDAPLGPGGTFLQVRPAGADRALHIQVDTGSTGIAIPMSTIKKSTPIPPNRISFIAYNSSGRAMCGHWVKTDITLSDRNREAVTDRKSTRLNSSHVSESRM